MRGRLARLVTLLLAVATLVAFAEVRHHEFVNYDDVLYVTGNDRVQRGLTLDNVRWAFTATDAANWHPLTWLSHMLDCQLFGLDAGRHHLTSLALHVLNALLLFAVLHAMTSALWQSAVVAALFALHPLHVESVAYIGERKDVLSTFFWMLTMWAYVRYVRAPSIARYLLVPALLALGLMAKPMLVTLPFVLLLLDLWPLRRLSAGAVVEKVPLFLMVGAASVVTFVVQQQGGSVIPLEATSIADRSSNAALAYVAYLRKTLWPADLACFYPYPERFEPWRVTGAALLLAGLTAGAAAVARRFPYVAVGWLWYLGTLVPVIGIVQVGAQSMADHYTYVPLIGLFLIVAWGVPDVLARWQYRRPALTVAGTVLLVACLLATRSQVRHWRSSTTLFTHALAVTSANHLAHNNLGLTMQEHGRLAEAVDQFGQALLISPGYADAHYNLGIALAEQGKPALAIAEYRQAIRFAPAHARAHSNLGQLLWQQGHAPEAMVALEEALRIDPDYPEAHVNLGGVLRERGRLDEAIAHYERALAHEPDHPAAHFNLANALVQQHRIAEARAHYVEALRLKPDYAEAHYNLGNVLAGEGAMDEAIAHYREAIRGKPDYPEAHNNLGRALATQGKIDDAMAAYTEALRLNPDLAAAYYNRGTAYRQRGETEKADADLARARTLDPRFR